MRLITILLLLITSMAWSQTVPSYTVQAGPTTGSPGTAKFRLLVAGDIPQLPWTNITGATTGGTTGQVLTYDFNGASPHWANAVNTALNYNWTGDHTFNSPGAFEVVTGGGVSFEATSDISFASGGELSFDGTSDIKFFDNAHYNSGYSGAGESDSWLTSKAYVDAHSSSVTPAALTRVNDTNLIATLGGTPNTALLQAVSITLSWSGTLAAARLNSSVVQGVTNDTNVTGSISAQNLTLGWAGTLAAARLNANVVQAVTNETNITGSISAQTLTFAWSGTLAAARLNANVVQGVTNDTNITGSIATQNITLAWAGTLAYSRLVNGAGLSVVGRSANTSGVQADIAAGSDFNILRRSGSSIGFGSIDLSQSGAVGSSILPIANGGTGAATFTGYLLASGGTASASNTRTYNTANWNNVTGTFTATANNQFHTNETGTLTARATASDALSYKVMDASLVYAAATQTLKGLSLAFNFNNTSAQTTPTMVVLDIAPTVTGTNPTNMIMFRTPATANWNVAIGNTTSSARLTVAGSGTTTGIAFLVANSSIATKFSVADNGNTSIAATGASTGLNIATTWTATANNNNAFAVSGTLTARSTANDILSWMRYSGGMTTGSTGQTLRPFHITPALTINHTTATIVGFEWDPTITGTQAANVTHIAAKFVTGSVLIGGSSLTASGLLDLQSTTQAFLPPRMTSTQRDAIASPSAGMVIYNTTTNKLNVYTTAWEGVTSL